MTKTNTLDPFKMWKNIYDQTESSWSDIIQQSMRKESFSEGMGETLNQFLQFQELTKKMSESYLEQMNVPSRDELASVASLVINLEDKIDNLEDSFEKDIEKLDQAEEITELRNSVTDLDKKMDLVLQAIEGIKTKEQAASADKNASATATKSKKK